MNGKGSSNLKCNHVITLQFSLYQSFKVQSFPFFICSSFKFLVGVANGEFSLVSLFYTFEIQSLYVKRFTQQYLIYYELISFIVCGITLTCLLEVHSVMAIVWNTGDKRRGKGSGNDKTSEDSGILKPRIRCS